MKVEKGTWTGNNTTPQTISLSDSTLTPQAIIVWTKGPGAAGFTATATFSIGFGTRRGGSTQSGCVGFINIDAVDPQDNARVRNTTLLHVLSSTSATDYTVSLDSFAAGQFTVSYSSAANANGDVFHYLVIGEVDDANVLNWTMDSTTAEAVTGVGFLPQVLFALDSDLVTANSITANIAFSFGFATSNAKYQSMAITATDADTMTSSQNWNKAYRTDACLERLTINADTSDARWDLNSFDSDGATLGVVDAPTNTDRVATLLFIKGGQWDSISQAKDTDTGNNTFTLNVSNLTPKGVLLFTSNQTSTGIATANTDFCIGAGTSTDGTQEGVVGTVFSESDPSATDSFSATDRVIEELTAGTPTETSEADLTQLNAGNFVINWAVNGGSAALIAAIAFGDAANVIPDALTATWSVVTPTVNARNEVTPTPISAAWSVVTPTVANRNDVIPTPLVANWSFVDPIIHGPIYAFERFFGRWFGGFGIPTEGPTDNNVTPTPLVANWSVVTPTVYASNELTPTSLTATWSVVTPIDACPAGPYYPSTSVNDSSAGTISWSTPDNAKLSDDSYATVVLAVQDSQYLKVTNFPFNIASEKVIKGIKVEVEAKTLLGNATVNVRVVKNNVILNDVVLSDDFTTTESFHIYGSSTELWGNSWTPTDINANNFGVAIRMASATDTISVDSIRVTIYCAPPPQTVTPTSLEAAWSIVTPTLYFENELTPDALTASWSVVTPTVSVGGINLTPDALTASWGVVTPTVSVGGINLTPDALTASWSVVTPTLTAGGVNLTPDALTASWSFGTPNVTSGGQNVFPESLTITWSIVTPTLTAGGVNLTPDALTASWSVVTPTIYFSNNLTPDALTASWSVVTLTLTAGGVNLTPDALTASWSVVTPSMGAGAQTALPNALIITWSIVTPTINLRNNLTPSDLNLLWLLESPIIDQGVINLTPTSLNTTWLAISPTSIINGGVNLTPDALTASWSTGIPTIHLRHNLIPNEITLTWLIEPPVLVYKTNVQPTPLIATWTVGAPLLNGAQLAIPTPLILVWSVTTPSRVGSPEAAIQNTAEINVKPTDEADITVRPSIN